MKIIYCFLFVFVFISTAFGQNEVKLLNKAYKKQSTELLQQFFNGWYAENSSITKEELDNLSPLRKEAYAVFETFYNSLSGDIKKEYLLLGNYLEISIQEKLRYYTSKEKDSIIQQKYLSNIDSTAIGKIRAFRNKHDKYPDRYEERFHLYIDSIIRKSKTIDTIEILDHG